MCICNDSVQTENDTQCSLQRNFLGTFGISIFPHQSKDSRSLDKATGLVEEYTKRKLSYESDALNGISGVLEVLKSQDSSLQHCHAIPFVPVAGFTGSHYTKVQMGLNWVHMKQANRRAQFPSWSPLGWEGAIRFHSYEHPYFDFSKDMLTSLDRDTRFIRITGWRVMLSLRSILSREGSSFILYVVLPNLEQSTRSILAAPHWDSRSTDTGAAGSVLGIMLGLIGHIGPMVLLLTQRGSHFERVGCLPFHGRMPGETCRTIVRDENDTTERKIYLSPTYLEDMWTRAGTYETLVLV